MLELSHIHKYYNAGTVNEMCLFQDFSLTIQDGEFVSVVGSNGSGFRFDPDRRKRHHQHAGIQASAQDRSRLPESGNGNLPEHDDS